MTIPIRRALPAEIPALAAVLARAFLHDPMFAWSMVISDDIEDRIRSHLGLVDTLFATEGWMYRTEDGLGVMALVPPDRERESHAIDVAAEAGTSLLIPDGGGRYARLWTWIEGCLPAERHWLLDQLAVDPAMQGRGLGSAMARLAISIAEGDGLPLFLETGVARNVAWYERLGFSVMLDADAPDGGPHIWFLRRDPDAHPWWRSGPATIMLAP